MGRKLEQEIAALRAEKEEMAFILDAHRTSCKLLTGQHQQQQQQQQQQESTDDVFVKMETVETSDPETSVTVSPAQDSDQWCWYCHSQQRHPQLRLSDGGKDRSDPHLSADTNEDDHQSQHSQLWISTEKHRLHTTVQPQHRGQSAHLTVNILQQVLQLYKDL